MSNSYHFDWLLNTTYCNTKLDAFLKPFKEFILILQMKKLRPTENRSLICGHSASS